MGRAPCCDKANVKKGPWSPEEDSKLKHYIDQYGTGGNWISLPQKAGLKRCGKSCRLRWLNYLRPNLKHGDFSEHEDMVICTLFANIGSRWSIIAGQLPGRTDNDIKNYWNTKLKKKLLNLAKSETHSSPLFQNHSSPYHATNPSNLINPTGFCPEMAQIQEHEALVSHYYMKEHTSSNFPGFGIGSDQNQTSCSSSDGSWSNRDHQINIQSIKQEECYNYFPQMGYFDGCFGEVNFDYDVINNGLSMFSGDGMRKVGMEYSKY